MALNGEFLKEQEEKAKRKAEEEAAKPPKVKRKRRKMAFNANTPGKLLAVRMMVDGLTNMDGSNFSTFSLSLV